MCSLLPSVNVQCVSLLFILANLLNKNHTHQSTCAAHVYFLTTRLLDLVDQVVCLGIECLILSVY